MNILNPKTPYMLIIYNYFYSCAGDHHHHFNHFGVVVLPETKTTTAALPLATSHESSVYTFACIHLVPRIISVSIAVTPPLQSPSLFSDSDSVINVFDSSLTPAAAAAAIATVNEKDQVPFESIPLNMLKIESDEVGAIVRVKEETLDSPQFERKELIELETEEIGPKTRSRAKRLNMN